MHRSELHEMIECADCGVLILPEERAFAFGEDQALCFACAVLRAGAYDERRDRWEVSPHLEGLHP